MQERVRLDLGFGLSVGQHIAHLVFDLSAGQHIAQFRGERTECKGQRSMTPRDDEANPTKQ